MNIYVWDKNSNNKIIIPNESYCTISEELTDYACATNRPPNIESFCADILEGKYDNTFDFSKNFIDIGACHGVYSIELLKKFNYCYSFEPNKLYYHIVGINSILNNVENRISIYNTFLSDKNENCNYNGWVSNEDDISKGGMLDTTSLTNGCYEQIYNSNKAVYSTIPTKTLDSYNFNDIGFIKIDTEGNELRILKGAISTIIRNNYPPILFEMWPAKENFIIDKNKYHEYCDNLIAFIKSFGYKIIYDVTADPGTHLAIK